MKLFLFIRTLYVFFVVIAVSACNGDSSGGKTATYTIGGTVSGLTENLILLNNGENDLTISTDGTFTFNTPITSGESYNVTVSNQPFMRTCNVSNASGSSDTDVTNIRVNCVKSSLGLTLSYDIKQIQLSWSSVLDATHYQLLENLDGSSGYTQVGANLTTTRASIDIPVHLYNWVNASYMVAACNATECINSETVTTINSSTNAIGYFKASNTEERDFFGISLSLSADGNTLAVGATREDSQATGINGNQSNNNVLDSGAVYLFSRNDNRWSQQAYIKASNTEANDHFGVSLSLSADGNTLAVGAYREDSNAIGINGDQLNNYALDSGAVYLFNRSENRWSQQTYIKASNTEAGDNFGWSVSLSDDGNSLAVGADGEASNATGINGDQLNNSANDSGAVYLFNRSDNRWSQQAYIKASNTEMDDRFGVSVSLSGHGNTLAVGAEREDGYATGINGDQLNNNALDSGAVYLFNRSNHSWSQQAYVKASNTEAGDSFGFSVSLSADGNTLAVGAMWEDSNAMGINGDQLNNYAFYSGAVYLFDRSDNWSQEAYIKGSNTEADDHFGRSLSLSADGNTLAVGGIYEDSNATGINGDQLDNSVRRSGAVYLFNRSDNPWSQQAYIKASSIKAFDWFGFSLSLSADGNALAVGTAWEDSRATGINGDQSDNSASISGAAYLY